MSYKSQAEQQTKNLLVFVVFVFLIDLNIEVGSEEFSNGNNWKKLSSTITDDVVKKNSNPNANANIKAQKKAQAKAKIK